MSERVVWMIAAVPSFWAWSYAVTRGSDLWWHLAGGRWAVTHRAVPLADPFSFTAAGRPWLNDAWLSDLVLYGWTRAFGLHALAWWKWGMVVGTFLLLLWTLGRLCERDGAAPYLACLLALAVTAPFLDMRPQLFSFLGFVAVLALTVGRPRPSWGLPLVFLAWVNLHAGVLFGLLALPVLLLPALAAGDAALRRRALLVIALAAAACLVNPSGIAVFTRPLRYAFDPGSPFRSIGEWQPPFRPGGLRSAYYPLGIGAFVLAALAVLAAAARRRPALPPWIWNGLALGGVTLAMSLRSRRFIPLFAIALTLVVAPVLHRVLAPLRARLPAGALPAAVALLGLAWLAPYPQASYAFHYLTAEDSFPIATGDFIEANALAGDVFAYYNWGGYLHWRTAGRMRVFIDGRAEAVFDDETYRRYLRVLGGAPGWPGVIADSGARFVLWPRARREVPAALVAGGGWRPLYEDAVALLLVRADHALGRDLVPPPPSAYRETAAGLFRLERGMARAAIPHLERALDEIPYLGLACLLLARAQASAGDGGAARATAARCDDLFPRAAEHADLERWIASHAGRR